MASGDLTITLSRVGSFRAGRHGDYGAHSQAFDFAGGVAGGGGAGVGSGRAGTISGTARACSFGPDLSGAGECRQRGRCLV